MQGSDLPGPLVSICVIAAIGFITFVCFSATVMSPWLKARRSGASIPLVALLAMRLRKSDVGTIVDAAISLSQAGIEVPTIDLETHCLAQGNVPAVAEALVLAKQEGIELRFPMAAAIDLAGRDVVAAVRSAFTPRVLPLPDPTWDIDVIEAATQDGAIVRAKARVTVVVNINRLVGGAMEQTLLNIVGKRIHETITNTTEPAQLDAGAMSNQLMQEDLTRGIKFDIVSLDIDLEKLMPEAHDMPHANDGLDSPPERTSGGSSSSWV
jgi:uncharacterized protein YqfA (UPF0365 family)